MDSKGNSGKIAAFLMQKVQMAPTDWLVDCVIAAGAFGFGILQLTVSVNLFVPDDFTRRMLGIQSVSPSAFAVAATLLMCLPLVLRRKFPWPVFAATILLWVAFECVFNWESLSIVSILVALFTIAYERGRGEALASGCIALAVTLLLSFFGRSSSITSLMLLQNVSFVVAVALAGYALHVRQEYLEAAEARAIEAERLRVSESRRAAEAERTRESEASRRVEEERVRIAREVHDITAHSLSAVNIQATAAERLMDVDAAAAKDAIREVRKIAKSSLEDMRSIIGVLRSGEEPVQTAPTEGTDRMADLVAYLEGAGVTCSLLMDQYDRTAVPTHVDVGLFGIAREACTNIVRHACATEACIELATEDEGEKQVACLSVSDNGSGISPRDASESQGSASGNGIRGMRERAKLLGGTFDVDSGPEGGTQLKVRIPL